MEELLRGLSGRKIDVNCGSNVLYRGEVKAVAGGVLTIVNEEGDNVFIALEKIAAVCECRDFASRPGFIV